MDKSFENISINYDLLNEIWNFDPRQLDTISGADLSKYAMCLSQYLIYFTYERNKTKAEIHRLNKYMDRNISLKLSNNKDILKEHKTKADAINYLISVEEDLLEKQSKLDELNLELIKIEGIDKSISELIATIKRELTRRENELYTVRRERR